MRLLIVDDSVVFRSQIKTAVESSIAVNAIGTAANGKIALQKLQQESYDVMTLDMEMPEMNGMETLKEIRSRGIPIKVVVFAAQNLRGATSAMEALKLGAIDVVSKPDGSNASFDTALQHVRDQLLPILKEVHQKSVKAPPKSSVAGSSDRSPVLGHANTQVASASATPTSYRKVLVETFRPKIVVVGSSTGGPNALEALFTGIRAPVTVPILIVQHMPPVFTASLAARLGAITGLDSFEAKHGEPVVAGRIYVAPGDYHMGLLKSGDGLIINLSQGEKRCNVRPAVDVLFEDVAKCMPNQVGAFVLTGMGEDGMLGCKAIKNSFGAVMIQDRETSVVWGMPGAVHAAGAFDKMGSLQDCARVLQVWSMGAR
jgi:two-component system chemotaxis response regulator CheB